ncbi:MAG: phosphate ABC transporter permease PstA [Sphingomonadales bacterium]
MNDAANNLSGPTRWQSPEMEARIRQRYRRERRFRLFGLGCIGLAGAALVLLLISVAWAGVTGFTQTRIALDVYFDPEILDVTPQQAATPEGLETLQRANYAPLVRDSIAGFFGDAVSGRSEIRRLARIISSGARFQLQDMVLEDPSLVGQTQRVWLIADDVVDQFYKGKIDRALPEADRTISDETIAWVDQLEQAGRLKAGFNWTFFTSGDSRDPELAGIWGAIKGSFLTLLVTLAVAFPLGVAAAVYLEEFAPRNRWTDLIEVNINNLAAVPSIVFGLLGLAVLLGTLGLPRSTPLVGGLTLALMTLPTIIIAARVAITAVPPSIRDAAMGLGASPMQVVFHHVLPLAMPGIMTGTIIGMARALGETAPLLMIGMVAFIIDVPQGITDAATVMPVQIFIWADSPERAFVEKTSAAIIVLLVFLVLMNALAVFLRNKLEKRW